MILTLFLTSTLSSLASQKHIEGEKAGGLGISLIPPDKHTQGTAETAADIGSFSTGGVRDGYINPLFPGVGCN